MFDLEKAIKAWKKGLAKNEALEDTYLAELEAALRDEVADLVRRGEGESEAFRRVSRRDGGSHGRRRRIRQGPAPPAGRAPRPAEGPTCPGPAGELRPHRPAEDPASERLFGHQHRRPGRRPGLLRADDALGQGRARLRPLSRQRRLDLPVAHGNEERDRRHPRRPGPDPDSARPSKPRFPEVLDFCRYRTNKTYGVKLGDKKVWDDVIGIADPSFFTMFTFPFLKGDPEDRARRSALDRGHGKPGPEVLRRRGPHGQAPDRHPRLLYRDGGHPGRAGELPSPFRLRHPDRQHARVPPCRFRELEQHCSSIAMSGWRRRPSRPRPRPRCPASSRSGEQAERRPPRPAPEGHPPEVGLQSSTWTTTPRAAPRR